MAANAFNYDNVEPFARSKAQQLLYDGCQQLSAMDVMSHEENENTYMIAQIVKLVHHNKKDDNDKSNPYTFYNRNANGSRQRNMPTFDRMIFLTDELNHPQMFVMIFQFDEGRTFFEDLQHDIVIGRFVVIYEPFNKNGNSLQELPVIHSNYPCLPLISSYISTSPRVPYHDPVPGLWYFFRYHGISLSFSGAQIITRTAQKPPACGGTFCDRQDFLVKSSGCGCFFIHKTDTVVLQVKIKTPDLPVLVDFRSLRLTRATIASMPMLSKMPAEDILCHAHKELRNKLHQLSQFINENGGFTIVGYTLKSQQKDASDQTHKIEAEVPNIHIAYIYPTNQDLINLPEYKTRMFRLANDTIDMPATQLPAVENVLTYAQHTFNAPSQYFAATTINVNESTLTTQATRDSNRRSRSSSTTVDRRSKRNRTDAGA